MWKVILVAMLLFCVFAANAFSQTNAESKNKTILRGIKGPAVIKLGDIANINMPAGYGFIEKKDLKTLFEITHSMEEGDELGAVIPESSNWYMTFSYHYTGHIVDDEKKDLDIDAMLAQIKNATQAENKERIKRGWGKATVVGWDVKPNYNNFTNNLELAIRSNIDDLPCVNYRIILLGREGVVVVEGVLDPDKVQESLTGMRSVIANFSFNSGQKYAEYRQGDKLARYGLTALVTGGTAAVAVKYGIGKWLGSAILAAGVGAAAYIRKLFKRKK